MKLLALLITSWTCSAAVAGAQTGTAHLESRGPGRVQGVDMEVPSTTVPPFVALECTVTIRSHAVVERLRRRRDVATFFGQDPCPPELQGPIRLVIHARPEGGPTSVVDSVDVPALWVPDCIAQSRGAATLGLSCEETHIENGQVEEEDPVLVDAEKGEVRLYRLLDTGCVRPGGPDAGRTLRSTVFTSEPGPVRLWTEVWFGSEVYRSADVELEVVDDPVLADRRARTGPSLEAPHSMSPNVIRLRMRDSAGGLRARIDELTRMARGGVGDIYEESAALCVAHWHLQRAVGRLTDKERVSAVRLHLDEARPCVASLDRIELYQPRAVASVRRALLWLDRRVEQVARRR